MYKIGLSTYDKPICKELFENYRNAGIEAMEICVNPEEYSGIDYNAIMEWSKEFGVDLWSYHLPFGPSEEIDISKRNTCEYTIRYYEELIKKATGAGIKRFIVHPSGEPIDDEERSERMKCSKESLFRLATVAQKNDAVIAVEDLPRTCLGKNSDEIAELIGVHEGLRVCFDTNHLLSENPADFIHKLGDKIITTHISDYDFIDEKHWLPGEGKIDWSSLIKAFDDIKYNGVWLYEISFICPKTITRSRDLTCEDFSGNARKLFEKSAV